MYDFFNEQEIICFRKLNGFNHWKWLNGSILPKYGTLTGTIIPIESEPGSNGNEGIVHIFQRSRN